MIFISLVLFLILAGLMYLYLIWNFDYWKRRGIDGPQPTPFLGNYPSLITRKQHVAFDLDNHYKAFKGSNDFVGIFSCRSPQLLVTSPAMVRRVYVNDFKHFHDNESSASVDEKSDFIFANNPLTLTGEKWKERRGELSPCLALSRVKSVFPVTMKSCQLMIDYITTHTRSPSKDGLDCNDIGLRFTSQLVTDCVLGMNAESFAENPTPVLRMIRKLFDKSFSFLFVYLILIGIFPVLKSIWKARFIPKPIEKFFLDLMENAVTMRRAQTNPNERLDFMNYMLQLQEKKKLSTLRLTAHTMTFLLDGYETTATVLSHTVLLLGRYPEIQEKLRSEICENLGKSGDIDFDKLNELPYLDACVHESIRIFPPAFFSNKICTEPIELTNRNGRSVKLNRGDVVVLPLHAIMNDDEYYPRPEIFQPERFLEENGGIKKYRDMGLFYGFGDGPRVCLGMRFALIQIKAALAAILRDFNVHVNPKTRNDNFFDPTYFMTRLQGGIWIDFDKIQ